MIGRFFSVLRPILRIARALERIAFVMEQASGFALKETPKQVDIESEFLRDDHAEDALREWYRRNTGRDLPENADLSGILP